MATKLRKTPSLPIPGVDSLGTLRNLTKALYTELAALLSRGAEVLPKDGTEAMTAPLPLAQYTTAALPSAALYEGCLVYDTTTSTVKFSDGATWASL